MGQNVVLVNFEETKLPCIYIQRNESEKDRTGTKPPELTKKMVTPRKANEQSSQRNNARATLYIQCTSLHPHVFRLMQEKVYHTSRRLPSYPPQEASLSLPSGELLRVAM